MPRSVRVKGAIDEDLSVVDEDEDDDVSEASVSSDSPSSWSEYLGGEDDTGEDSLPSRPSDVVEAAAVPPRQANVIALMDLKALLNTPTEQVEVLLRWILEFEMMGKDARYSGGIRRDRKPTASHVSSLRS